MEDNSASRSRKTWLDDSGITVIVVCERCRIEGQAKTWGVWFDRAEAQAFATAHTTAHNRGEIPTDEAVLLCRCGAPWWKNGLCEAHYKEQHPREQYSKEPKPRMPRCNEDGCEKAAKRSGLCMEHYWKWEQAERRAARLAALEARGWEHGTFAGYSTHACRCDECRAYMTKTNLATRARRLARPIPERVHGTVNGYGNYGCRCEPCRAANSAANSAAKAAA